MKKNHRKSSLFIACLFTITIFTISCGGGGGGGGGTNPPPPTSSITYTGLTTQATVSASNVTDLSEGAYAGADFAASLGSTVSVVASQGKENRKGSSLPIQLPQIFENSLNKIDWKTGKITAGTMQSESGTFYGNCGGSGSYSLTYDDQTGNFTGQFVYYNYCEDNMTLSGSVSISGQININTLDFITFNFSFDGVTLAQGADSLAIKGDIHVYVSSASVTITENILLKNNTNNKVYWCKDYNLTVTNGGSYKDFTLSGTYYHPDYGYVVISTPTPFRIYNVDTTPSSGALRITGSGNTSAVLTALTSSTYCIQADTNGCGNNEWDSGVLCYVGGSCSGDMTPPSTPIDLTATATSSSQIDLLWTASTDNVGVAGYKIYRNGVYLKSVATNSTSDMGLSASTQYCYRVSAYDAANNESAQSTESCATTQAGVDTIPPSTPTGLTATASSSSQIELSWTASTDNVGVTGYKIYRNEVYLKSETSVSTSDTGLSASTQYCYKVSAYDATNNESAQSTQACQSTQSGGSWMGTKQLGTSSEDRGNGVAVDSSGNVYVTGSTGSNLDGNISAGGPDMFLVKYDAAGTKQWTRQLGTASDDYGYGVAVDASGNVYVTGYTGAGLDGNISAGFSDMFLVKYDAAGTKQWTRQLGTSAGDGGSGIAVDTSGNVYVTGFTYGGLDGNTNAGYGTTDMFLVKYNSAGVKQWTRQLGTSAMDAGRGIAVDTSGNVYVTGDTGAGLDGNTSAGNTDMFLMKYDATGTKQWTRQLGSVSSDEGRGVAIDTGGNVYVTGYTYGSLDGNTSAGVCDMFLVKYDAAGTKQWTRQLGTSATEEGYGVAVDTNGNIYVTGSTLGSLDGNTNVGSTDMFLVKYDAAGTKQWTQQLGTALEDSGFGVALDNGGNIYVTGWTMGSMDGNTNAEFYDMFLVKYDTNGVKQ